VLGRGKGVMSDWLGNYLDTGKRVCDDVALAGNVADVY
jgi:hypothetical protein